MNPALIVHGGAWDIPDEAVTACKAGCRRALEAGWSILDGGGSALDAIEAAIVILEDDPVFDAGFGSHLNLDGHVECDAIVMNGTTLRAGAVASLQHIRNPIRLARKVLEDCPHMMLVADGAERFAQSCGISLCDAEDLISEAEREAWQQCRTGAHASANHRGHEQGTVGAVAIDRNGSLFAATSTGGTCCKLPGRVGDSPLIGCGCYADLEVGGVSTTGFGEAIMKIVMAKTAADFLRAAGSTTRGSVDLDSSVIDYPVGSGTVLTKGRAATVPSNAVAMRAARDTIDLFSRRTGAIAGLILLDRQGNPGLAFNTPRMAHGYVTADGSCVVAV